MKKSTTPEWERAWRYALDCMELRVLDCIPRMTWVSPRFFEKSVRCIDTTNQRMIAVINETTKQRKEFHIIDMTQAKQFESYVRQSMEHNNHALYIYANDVYVSLVFPYNGRFLVDSVAPAIPHGAQHITEKE